MKVNESIKIISYRPHYASLLKEANFETDHAHFSKLCLLKWIILLQKQHFRIFQPSKIRNEIRRVNENHFLSLTPYISIKVSKFQTDHAHFSKLCQVKRIILVKKQHLGIFEQSNIGNESRWVHESNFASPRLCISIKVSRFQNWPRAIFKTVSAQMDNFASKTTFSNFSALTYSQWK